MSSSLVQYTKLSPNHSGRRTHKIDTITIHHMAGNLSIETCGNVFAPPSRQASSNYGIGSDGRIGMYVEEENRSWCSSNAANDQRAVTIEVANDGGAPDWHVSDKAIESLIILCADICKRNGIDALRWKGDKSLIGQVDKQNMTVHQWFKNKTCPGPYLYGKLGYIADEVNKILNGTQDKHETEDPIADCPDFYVKLTSNKVSIRKGPGTQYDVVKYITDGGKYTIVATSGNWYKLKSGAGWISKNSCVHAGAVQGSTSTPSNNPQQSTKSVSEVAGEVIRGSWGTGSERKRRLTQAGYNYEEVQAEVNRRLSGPPSTSPKPSKSIDEVAKEVINGKWGNGAERKRRLAEAGYNYAEVQAAVNRLI